MVRNPDEQGRVAKACRHPRDGIAAVGKEGCAAHAAGDASAGGGAVGLLQQLAALSATIGLIPTCNPLPWSSTLQEVSAFMIDPNKYN